MRTINERLQALAANALRIAAEEYGKDAQSASTIGDERLAQAFRSQRSQARALADVFDGADCIQFICCDSEEDEAQLDEQLSEALK